MFTKLLIANRGEIACRIIRTAKRMGIETVAVYSTEDSQALHVRCADEAYWIGDAPSKASYLNIAAILRVAHAAQAQAIHPGYGFLSENADFVRACEQENITFVGPSLAAMEIMASKKTAKRSLENTNVPLTPGYHGDDQSESRLLQEAKQLGFPVLLKAALGGGGKGMRTVEHEADFLKALASAKREAVSSFADDTFIIEKLITKGRHIEVQILADNHGQVLHLYERDCSLQRRHQKIIEEAPATHLSKSQFNQLSAAAITVAKTIGYRGAGTVEFMVDADACYFMEMNTRLQVEHPVTEMITGLDLVEWQLRIAANESLPAQKEISSQGHAIECRIYAEDPYHDFLPSVGTISFLNEPHMPGIRIDTGVEAGDRISPYYDPMIAKLIAWGDDRATALHRLEQALSRYVIFGIKSNIAFLSAILKHESFLNGGLYTHFLEKNTITIPQLPPKEAAFYSACYQYLQEVPAPENALAYDAFAWRSHLKSTWTYRYQHEEAPILVTIGAISPQQVTVSIGDRNTTVSLQRVGHELWIQRDSALEKVWIVASQDGFWVAKGPHQCLIKPYHHQTPVNQALGHQLKAPMSATVVAVLKKKGELIKPGELVMVLEAMKMEHAILAPKAGTLKEVYYAIGDQVNEGAELVALE